MGVLLPVFLPVFVCSVLFVVFVLGYSTRRVFGPRQKDSKKLLTVYNTPRTITARQEEVADVGLEVEPRPRRENLLSYEVRWDNIYSILSRKKGGKTVLHGCSGVVKPRELAAIVGPSGAGKTVLLDTLAMRRPASSGSITIGGKVRSAHFFKQISTYIQQDDAFVPTLSVVETLQLHACLRLPRNVGKHKRDSLIKDLVRDMGLDQVQHSQVGGLLPGGLVVRGLSGGEKRRLSIACGIVAQPAIIYADEPTSGLDSHAALVVMEHLRGLCAEGRTVICSIHQPRQAIWDMFDVVEVLSQGRLMYFGPKARALQWFTTNLGFSYNPQQNGSQADWLLDLVSVNFHEQPTAIHDRMLSEDDVRDASERFKAERLPVNMGSEASQTSTSGRSKPEDYNKYPTRWLRQCQILTWRALLAYTRNPADVAGRMMMAQGVAIMDGVVIMSGGNIGGYNINNAISVVTCIFTVTFTLLLLPFTHMSLYVSDRKFYALDVAANLYHPSAYYVAQAAAGAPFTLLNATVLTLIMYGLIGLRYTARAVLLTVVTVSLLSLVGVQILVLSAYLTRSQDLAFVVAVTYVTWSILLGGFIVRLSQLYSVLRVLSYLFPLRYTFQAFVLLQFEGLPTMNIITQFYDMDWSVGANLAALLGVLVGLHFLSIVAMCLLHQPQQKKLWACVAIHPAPDRTVSEYLGDALSVEVLTDVSDDSLNKSRATLVKHN
eukprot:jgi/Botrbrau1/10526/Bobra.7_1s0007.1